MEMLEHRNTHVGSTVVRGESVEAAATGGKCPAEEGSTGGMWLSLEESRSVRTPHVGMATRSQTTQDPEERQRIEHSRSVAR